MVLYTSQEFWKSVPREKKNYVEDLILRLNTEAMSSDSGIFGTSRKSQTRKFHGSKDVYKFRVNDSDRIIFTYSDNIVGLRDDDLDGIYLRQYVSHDEQSRVAKSMGPLDRDGFQLVEHHAPFSETDILPLDESDSSYIEKYGSFVDLERIVTYRINTIEEEGREILLKDARVDQQQFEYISDLSPMLVIGGAGSGKTLVTIHKASAYRGYENRVAYFTLSEHLRNNSEKIYQKMTAVGEVEFHSLKDFCLDSLFADEKRYVGFERFAKEFYHRTGEKEFDAFDVWAEIRGLIKGYMGSDWYRIHSFEFNDYPGPVVSYLKQNGMIAPVHGNDRILHCCLKNVHELHIALQRIKEDPNLQEALEISDALKKIFEDHTRFRYQTIKEKLIEEFIYLELDAQATIYDSAQRKKIYQIAQAYQQWLDQKELLDDNDLAAQLILNLESQDKSHKDAPYDFVVVDEVQDFTELQIYMLTRLVNSLDNITFAGDIHQIINPTYFRNDRLKKLYHLGGKELIVNMLNRNYRSQKSIVELANRLGEIRRKHIAKEKDVTEQLEVAMLDGNMPFYLKAAEENLKLSLQAISQRASACIIVAEESDRTKLEQIAGEPLVNLFTIQEIKGLEYEYVFCYNLASTYRSGWEDIFAGKAIRNSKYRFYFNVFYVAITRATENLCIYEEQSILEHRDELMYEFTRVDAFDEHELGITGQISSLEEWHEKGLKMEEAGRFDIARRYFEKANSPSDMKRCTARLEFDAGNHSYAIRELMKLREHKVAYALSSRISDRTLMLANRVLAEKQDALLIDSEYGSATAIKILTPYLEHEEFGNTVYDHYMAQEIELTRNKILDTSRLLNGMVN